ncbi:hypothetical protein [Kamptonema formosum]|uniref:hypothetical protein n=1 Tax=Kamptonema formosum TaxID=331992 RepID=UPI000349BC1C|nr:hypothetical protein [Oscillatoria sp. PCC 10802]
MFYILRDRRQADNLEENPAVRHLTGRCERVSINKLNVFAVRDLALTLSIREL